MNDKRGTRCSISFMRRKIFLRGKRVNLRRGFCHRGGSGGSELECRKLVSGIVFILSRLGHWSWYSF